MLAALPSHKCIEGILAKSGGREGDVDSKNTEILILHSGLNKLRKMQMTREGGKVGERGVKNLPDLPLPPSESSINPTISSIYIHCW